MPDTTPDAAGTFAPAIPLATVETACERIGERLGSVDFAQCAGAGLRMADGASRRGFPLLLRDYPSTSMRTTPRRVLLIGGIHGDELSAVSIVFKWMKHLETARFQPFEWRVLPCANPDGLLAHPSTRVNAAGVDLNRNFYTDEWDRTAISHWISRSHRDPRRYPGPSALSEPETRWLVREIAEFRPDAIVSVHAPYGVLDFDGPEKPPERFGYLYLHQLGTYPGSLGNYAGVAKGLPVITLELPYAGIMPTPAQQQRIWADMLTWLDKHLPAQSPLYSRLIDHPWLPPP